MKNPSSLIYWWEDDLTSEDRSRLMKSINYDGWKGTRKERNKKLVEMYEVWKKWR